MSLSKCCIHSKNVPDSLPLKRFTENTLATCREVLLVRKKYNFKYNDSVVPDDIGSVYGYHSKCYKEFTAVSKSLRESVTNEKVIGATTSSSSLETTEPNSTVETNLTAISSEDRYSNEPTESSEATESNESIESNDITESTITTGNIEDYCIICKRKGSKRRKLCVIKDETLKTVFSHLTEEVQDEVLKKLHLGMDPKWHKNCCRSINTTADSTNNSDDTMWSKIRKAHKEAFTNLKIDIENYILQDGQVANLLIYYNQYMLLLSEICDTEVLTFGNFKSHHLRSKLEKHFGNDIEWRTRSGRVIFFRAGLDISGYNEEQLKSEHIREAAFMLRKEILNIPKKRLIRNVKLEDIYDGDGPLPTMLITLLTNIIVGPRKRYQNSERKSRLIKSIASDIVYAVTNGDVKPAKHLQLGIALKNLCSSRKVLNIFNRLGHCVSYNVAEELETELTYTATAEDILIPAELQTEPHLATGIAFDNYDRFVETLDGKNTLHDTVGIIYQNTVSECNHSPRNETENLGDDFTTTIGDEFGITIDETQFPTCFDDTFEDDYLEPQVISTEAAESSSSITMSNPKKRLRRRRCYEEITFDIAPYRKIPKLVETVKFEEPIAPENLPYIKRCDIVWKICLALQLTNVPMWVGFTSQFVVDTLPIQSIAYLPQINMSPTSNSVVKETMNIALRVKGECKQPYMHVTYDLAIAKIALQIQSMERPIYDSIFISLGPFHIMMSAFKAIGKYIAESGLPDILTNSGLLACGSLNGYLTGKHFNRCKRIHPITAVAIEILHFKYFLVEKDEQIQADVLDDLIALTKSTGSTMLMTEKVKKLLTDYENFLAETLSGEHGKTAQYYMQYVQMVDLYHLFSRSVRTNDIPLFIYCLPQLINIFFAFNHVNYARWLIRYLNNLMNMDTTHPGLRDYLKNGAFTIRRTNKNFSRGPVDLTLEQTINADAANKLTGISHFTNSISARQRWAKSRFTVTSVISHLLNEIGLTKKDDVCAERKPYRIAADNKHVNNILAEFDQFMNPFTVEDKTRLYNVCTGKACSLPVENFLLRYKTIGKAARDTFSKECEADKTRFENPIQRVKTVTFANEGVKMNRLSSDGKVNQIQLERDHFAKLLCLSLENKLDVSAILSYPLTPIPLSLCHIDGSSNKTNNLLFYQILEQQAEHIEPSEVDATIVEGFFLLRSLIEAPATFGKISRLLLQKTTECKGHEIHLVFDQHREPSIKEYDEKRLSNDIPYVIKGPEQRRPTNYVKAFNNEYFKIALLKFLLASWSENQNASIIGQKRIVMNINESCYEISCVSNKVQCVELPQLRCNHEEAETRIIFHLNYIAEKKQNANVVIRASESEVMITALGNMYKINSHVWLETGSISKNTLRLIDLSAILEKKGTTFCNALISFHIFTGCRYSESFFGKGKKTTYKLFEKNEKIQAVFSSFGRNESISEKDLIEIEKFVCSLYGQKTDNVNEARTNIFNKTYGCKDPSKNILKITKSLDARSMPPCKKVLLQKVKRLKYISTIWSNATLAIPTTHNPLDFGWQSLDNKFVPLWFEGEQTPNSINEIIYNDGVGDDNESNDENESSDEDDFEDEDEISEPDD